MLIDNFRLDQWRIVQPLLSEFFNMEENLYTTILPTSTQYARNAIFAGLMPLQIATMYPKYWVDEDEDEGLNIHESQLVQTQLDRFRRKDRFAYTKINDSQGGEKFIRQAFENGRHTAAGAGAQFHRYAITCPYGVEDDPRTGQFRCGLSLAH